MIHCLYVIGTGWDEAIKIGVSSNPVGRLNAFNEMHPRAMDLLLVKPMEDAFSVEAHVHRCLDEARLNGEWFDGALLTEQMVIDAIASFPGVRRNRQQPDRYTAEAQDMARALVEDARFRNGLKSDEAMKLLADQIGVLPSLFWALHYRPTRRIYASDYFAVKAAHGAYFAGTPPRLPNEPEPTETPKETDK